MSTAPQNEEKQGDHYDGTEVNGGKKETALERYNAFTGEMLEREREIASMLPSNITAEKFRNTAIAAVKQNLDLINCTRRSLMAALTKAALDGLLPDGREGVITPFKGQAVWNPMAHGLRKRLREIDSIIADCQVVHANDKFIWHQGDEPRIDHIPAQLGQPRGDMIGAYALFKREDGTILHREVMDKIQIETTRKQSKAADSLMWTTFASEGYRKTVLRRGIKSVPVTETMADIIKRDDEEHFEFAAPRTEPAQVIPPSPPTPPTPPAITKQPEPPILPVEPLADTVPVGRPRQRRKGENRGEQPMARQQQNDGPTESTEGGDGPADAPAAIDSAEFADLRDDYLPMMLEEIKNAKNANDTHASHETFSDTVQGAFEKGRISRNEHDFLMEKWEKATS